MLSLIENNLTEISAAPMRVVITEDLREIREGLTALINGTSGFRCVASYGMIGIALPPACLLEALQEAAIGSAPMSPQIAARVVKLFREFRPPEKTVRNPTLQETALLKLLIEGHHKKTPPANSAFHTVSFHLKNIYEKLQVHSKTVAVAKALREKLV